MGNSLAEGAIVLIVLVGRRRRMIDLAKAADLETGGMEVGLNHIGLKREGKEGNQGGDKPPGRPEMSFPAAHMNP